MSYFITTHPEVRRRPSPLFLKRGAKHRRCDGVSQDISPLKIRHRFILITYLSDWAYLYPNYENKIDPVYLLLQRRS
jgi:hypothetical protein